MANKSQVTIDVKVNADAQIQNVEKVKKVFANLGESFSFNEATYKKIENYITKLEVAAKELQKISSKEGLFVKKGELANAVKYSDIITAILKALTSMPEFQIAGLGEAYKDVQALNKEMEKLQGTMLSDNKTKYQTGETTKRLKNQLSAEKQILNEQEKRKKKLEQLLVLEKARDTVKSKEFKRDNDRTEANFLKEQTGFAKIDTVERKIQEQRIALGLVNQKTSNVMASTDININKLKKDIEDTSALIDEAQKLDNKYKSFSMKKTNVLSEKASQQFTGIVNDFEDIIDSSNQASLSLGNAAKQSLYLGDAFEGVKNKISYFISLNFVFDEMISKIREAITVTENMDKDMTQIGLVLGKTSGQIWESFGAYSAMADRLNSSTSEVTQAMKLFYQQGLNTAEVNKMVEASAIAAALGETTLADASETLTSVINSYTLSANDAMSVTDKISEVAIESASDFSEISTAIEKVASSAANAGLDLDHLMGYLGKMIETTREAPTNIGTALKTIVANFAQFKEDPNAITDEGTSINDVDEALKSVGIQLLDSTGQMRNLGEVIDELGQKWKSLDRNTRSYLATTIAGTRQQSRFFALMQDYDRTMELVTAAGESSGRAQSQFELYSKSLEASQRRLTNQWEKFFNEITKGNGVLVKFYDVLTGVMKVANKIGPLGTLLGLTGLTNGLNSARASLQQYRDSLEEIQNLSFKTGENFSFYKEPDFTLPNIKENKKLIKQGELDYARKQLEAVNLKRREKNEPEIFMNDTQLKAQVNIEKYRSKIESLKKDYENLGSVGSKAWNKLEQGSQKVRIGFEKAKVGVKAFTGALKGMAISFGIMLAMQVAIGLISKGLEGIQNLLGGNAEKYAELADKASSNADSIKGLAEEYENLIKKVNRTQEEEERLKEITKEVTKVDAALGEQLESNANNYETNIRLMEEYIEKQKKIAAQNEAQSIIAAENVWAHPLQTFGQMWEEFTTGDDSMKKSQTTSAKNKWENLATQRGIEYGLTTQQTSMLNRYVESYMKKLEEEVPNATGTMWDVSIGEFNNVVVEYIKSLKNLTDTQQESYSDFLSDMSDTNNTFYDLKKKLNKLNLPKEIKDSLSKQLSDTRQSIQDQIKANPYINNEEEVFGKASSILSLSTLDKLFNPSRDNMTDEEYNKYYKSDLAKFLSDDTLMKKYIQAQEKGGLALSQFSAELLTSGNYTSVFTSTIIDATKALDPDAIEDAFKALHKIGDLDINKVMAGQESQEDIFKELAKGNLDFTDLLISSNGTMSIKTSALIAKQQEQYDKIFESIEKKLVERESSLEALTDPSSNRMLGDMKTFADSFKNLADLQEKLSYYGFADEYGGQNGNINVNARKVVRLNDQGDWGTDLSMTTDVIDGFMYVIPQIYDGAVHAADEAEKHFKETGEYFAKFTEEEYTKMVQFSADMFDDINDYEFLKETSGAYEENGQWYAMAGEVYTTQLHARNADYAMDENGDPVDGTVKKALEDYFTIINDTAIKKLKEEDQRFIEAMSDEDLKSSVEQNVKDQRWNQAYAQEYAKRNVSTGIEDVSGKSTQEQITYLNQQVDLFERTKQELETIEQGTQEWYNKTYLVSEVGKDIITTAEKNADIMNDLSFDSGNLKNKIEETKSAYNDVYNSASKVKNIAKEQLEIQKQQVEKAKEALSKNLNYQKAFAGFFDGLNMDNAITSQLDAVKEAYQQLGETITDVDQLKTTLANNPMLIQALEVENEGLTWNAKKLEEVGQAAINSSNEFIDGKIKELQAVKVILEQEADDMDQWSDETINSVAEVIGGSNSLINTQVQNASAEATNLGLSEQSWIQWSTTVVEAINAAGQRYNEWLKSVANQSEGNFDGTPDLSTRVGTKSGVGPGDVTSNKETIKQALKSTGYEQNKKGAIANINKQIALLEGLKKSNQYKSKNMGKYLGGDLYNPDSGSKDKDTYEPQTKELEIFYNYLRKIEKLEEQINRIQKKREIIDSVNNKYIESLKQENSLLQSQTKLYSNYIEAQNSYLDGLRRQISSQYGDWAYFDENGTIQVSAEMFIGNTEEATADIENFMDLIDKYKEAYNSREQNLTKLYEIEKQILDNIAEMYEKILSQLDAVTNKLKNVNEQLEHQIEMTTGDLNDLQLLNKELENTAKLWKEASNTVNSLKGDMQDIQQQVASSANGRFLQWNDLLGQYEVTDEFNNMVNSSETMNSEFADIVTWVYSMAKASEEVSEKLDDANQTLMDSEKTIKSIVENRLSKVKDLLSGWKDEIVSIFDIINKELDKFSKESALFGTNGTQRNDQYFQALYAQLALAQKTVGELRDKQESLLNGLVKDYGKYISVIGDSVYLNEQAIEETTELNEIDKAILKERLEAYKQVEETVSNASDTIYTTMEEMQQLYEQGINNIIDLKNQIHDYIIQEDQDELDNLRDKYAEMQRLDNEYYNSLTQKINDAKKAREMEQQQNNIATMQRRAAVLQKDNSGNFSAELQNLNTQIRDALQNQADEQMQLELERIKREQEQHQEDMDMQTRQLENLITFKDENGIYWQEARQMWAEGYQSVLSYLSTQYTQDGGSPEEVNQKIDEAKETLNLAMSDFILKFDQYLLDFQGQNLALNTFLAGIMDESMTASDEQINLGLSNLGTVIESLQLPDAIANNTATITQATDNIITNFKTAIDQTAMSTMEANNILNTINADNERRSNGIISNIMTQGRDISAQVGGVREVNVGISNTTKEIDSSTKDIKSSNDDIKGTSGRTATATENGSKYLEYIHTNIISIIRHIDDLMSDLRATNNNTYEMRNTLWEIKNKLYGGFSINLNGSGGSVGFSDAGFSASFSMRGYSGRVYKKGGYVDYTGPAWVDGTSSSPEAFLNAKQTALFEDLRDNLTSTNPFDNNGIENYNETTDNSVNIENFEMNVKEVAEADSIEKITKIVKSSIYKDATGSKITQARRR